MTGLAALRRRPGEDVCTQRLKVRLGGVPEVSGSTARILSLDPSYRILTLQSPNGEAQTFKVGLDVQLGQMQAGDDVMIRAPQIVSLSMR